MPLPHSRPYTLSFKNPLTEAVQTGDLLDEICRPEPDVSRDEFGGGAEAMFVAQLVQWGGNKRIRICYYTRRAGQQGDETWRFSMNPPSMAPEECRKLFETMQAKGWFTGSPSVERMDKSAHMCPECGHVFKGRGWDGIDAHWKAKHEQIMPYKEAWAKIKDGTYER